MTMFDSLYECYVAQFALCEVSLHTHNIFGASSDTVIRQHEYYKTCYGGSNEQSYI